MSNYTVPDLVMKFTSRKFLLAFAAFLLSLGTGLMGLDQGNSRFTMIGVICAVVSAAVYAGCEAYTDGKALEANQVITEIQQATSSMQTQQLTATTNDKGIATAMTNVSIDKPVE